ncbi:hypothetical protein BWI93_07685 [Siphonobacter sp. BAB-5385]|uniref:glycosyl-4,4'-diaponeurosporenoate acyltransferase CrtO family protein n=1 Tax=Siphonobacter sp. BAB-5385 TaxID=1864822 RepID=UPI000B9E5E01|nr:hypothetical protein [Siphonobacter sp. BAB-5385]OZI08726.1 hypothetical protein BWI93_07685 [Siphonobacter sp. BAB-5385]
MFLKWVKLVPIVSRGAISTSFMFRYLDVTSVAFSVALNFFLMFWVTLFESQWKPGLQSAYFNPYPFEKQGKVYRWLGVEGYQAILTKSGWEKLRQQQTPIKKDLQAFLAYERASRVAEASHVVMAGIILLITGYVVAVYSIRDALWLIVFNLFFNIYPILLQRYTRPRLQRMIRKFKVAEPDRIYS